MEKSGVVAVYGGGGGSRRPHAKIGREKIDESRRGKTIALLAEKIYASVCRSVALPWLWSGNQ